MINHLCQEKLDNMNANKKVKIAAAAIAVALCCEEDNEKRRKEWVKPWLQRRNTHGSYSQLLSELRLEVELFTNYLRMTPEKFNEILVLIRDDITKNDTPMREPIPPEIKLAVTIPFLATGTTFEDLLMCFRVHKSTIGKFVPEVCEAILKNDYFQVKSILIGNYIF